MRAKTKKAILEHKGTDADELQVVKSGSRAWLLSEGDEQHPPETPYLIGADKDPNQLRVSIGLRDAMLSAGAKATTIHGSRTRQ